MAALGRPGAHSSARQRPRCQRPLCRCARPWCWAWCWAYRRAWPAHLVPRCCSPTPPRWRPPRAQVKDGKPQKVQARYTYTYRKVGDEWKVREELLLSRRDLRLSWAQRWAGRTSRLRGAD